MPELEDPMIHSFGMPGYDMHVPMISGGGYGTGMSPLGMGMGMGAQLADPYDMWNSDGLPHMDAESNVHVKKEPTWDESSYRQL